MDANYNNEMEEYTNKIAETLNSLNEEIEAINTPVVPASEKLKNAGNNLYIDSNGVLKCQPNGFSKSLSKHFGEFAKEASVGSGLVDAISATFVQGA